MTKDIHNQNETSGSEFLKTPCSAWMSIETAPKDGTEIIVGYDFASVWIVHNAFYDTGVIIATDGTEVELWKDQGYDSQQEAEGWWSYVKNSVSQHKLDGANEPTHWIPLPYLPNREVVDCEQER